MLSFECDYNNGAHPAILKRLLETNNSTQVGYGEDEFTTHAKHLIAEFCGKPDAEVYLLTGGTQTNVVVLSAILKPFEGVLTARTGHIHTHEAGALEYTGTKAIELPSHNGKIKPEDLSEYLSAFYADVNREHMVFPGAVYISHPTEYGTLYSRSELVAISSICRSYGIRLFLDGARLGYGLMSYNTDVSIQDITDLCDVFYIGGTKVGALCGEAVVFPNGNLPQHFPNHVKKHGAMLAKGRLIGIQFEALFSDGLYCMIALHAIEMAERLKAVLHEKGYRFFLETDTNQQFVILSNEEMNRLSHYVRFSYWERYDSSHTVVRFATSWSTTIDDIESLRRLL